MACESLLLSNNARLRTGFLALLYFAHGLPNGLFGAAILPWASVKGMSASDIAGIAALGSLPWGFKLVGAAIIDRYNFRPMGHRRPWIIISNLLIVGGLVVAMFVSPGPLDARLIGWLGFSIMLGCAMLDAAADGLAVQILPEGERGTASAFMYAGQAFGISLGALLGSLFLVNYGSGLTFGVFATIAIFITLIAFLVREDDGDLLFPWGRPEKSNTHYSGTFSPRWNALIRVLFSAIARRDSLFLIAASLVGGMIPGAFNAFWPSFATKQVGIGTAEYGQLMGIGFLTVAFLAVPVGSYMLHRLGPRMASLAAFLIYVLIALSFVVFSNASTLALIFISLTAVWLLADLLISICMNPLRMRFSVNKVGATQFTAYTSAFNLTKPLGALFVGVTYGAGMTTFMMIGIIVTVAICAVLLMEISSGQNDTECGHEIQE